MFMNACTYSFAIFLFEIRFSFWIALIMLASKFLSTLIVFVGLFKSEGVVIFLHDCNCVSYSAVFIFLHKERFSLKASSLKVCLVRCIVGHAPGFKVYLFILLLLISKQLGWKCRMHIRTFCFPSKLELRPF